MRETSCELFWERFSVSFEERQNIKISKKQKKTEKFLTFGSSLFFCSSPFISHQNYFVSPLKIPNRILIQLKQKFEFPENERIAKCK